MTTFRLASDLAGVMVPIGIVGAAMAGICAVVAAIAIIRGASGLSGGAVGLWIVGALVSFTASFANQWMPLFAACASLVAMLVIGGVVRAIVGKTEVVREPRPRASVKPSAPVVQKSTSVSASTNTASVVVVR